MKRKVCVYAICKNEAKFVERWYNSMKEADLIIVGDTGSTDDTIEKLKNFNIEVHSIKIDPWRFDKARNAVLDLIPDDIDICISTDLDEVFNKGWRKELEKSWKDNTNRLKYIYNWSLDENNKPIVSFYYEKIHSRKEYRWVHPVHEVLKFDGIKENVEITDNIILNHYPDSTKSRGSYLPLLELSVKEEPENDRNMHYLGREYMYHNMWNESIDTLIKHLNLKNATWKDERCASMRFIARCYTNLKRYDEARMWLDKAIKEAPYLRDPYVERSLLEYRLENWDDVIKYSLDALKIERHERTYINETFSWDATIYDLLSISYFYKNEIDNAIININKALEIEPENERILNNKKIFDEYKETLK